MSLRAAVLGASGFGRHHVKWYTRLGCEVVAFLGSSAQSVEATRQALAEAIGFKGRGYVVLADLLAAETPDAVSICTPSSLHGEAARACLQAGCSVLCEKPLVWRPDASSQELVAEARSLAEEAERRGLVLSVNTQYAAAAEAYRTFLPQALAERSRFTGEMTSRIKPDGPRGRAIWLDLAPHPISFLLSLLPDAEFQRGSVEGQVEPEETQATFDLAAGGTTCRAEVRVAKLPNEPFPRCFGFGDYVADCGSEPNEAGEYHGVLRFDGRQQTCDDFMKTSIERFCAAVSGEGQPLVSAGAAVRALEILLAVLDETQGGPHPS
jgi:predicted dehydrogenase